MAARGKARFVLKLGGELLEQLRKWEAEAGQDVPAVEGAVGGDRRLHVGGGVRLGRDELEPGLGLLAHQVGDGRLGVVTVLLGDDHAAQAADQSETGV